MIVGAARRGINSLLASVSFPSLSSNDGDAFDGEEEFQKGIR